MSDDPLGPELGRQLSRLLAEAAVLVRAWAQMRQRRAEGVAQQSDEQRRAAQLAYDAQMELRRAEWRIPASEDLYRSDPERAARVWAEARQYAGTEPLAWRAAAGWDQVWQQQGVNAEAVVESVRDRGDLAGGLLAQIDSADARQQAEAGLVAQAWAAEGVGRDDAKAAAVTEPGTAADAGAEQEEAITRIDQHEAAEAAADQQPPAITAGSEPAVLSAKAYPKPATATRPHTRARPDRSRPASGPQRVRGR